MIIGPLLESVDGDVGCNVAVGDGAAGVFARDAADIFIASDAGVGKRNAVDVGTTAYIPKEALESFIVAVAAFIDAYTTDGVAVAVEVATEGTIITGVDEVADGGEVVLGARGVVPVGGVAVGDVVGELEVLAVVVADAVVDARGEQFELILVLFLNC